MSTLVIEGYSAKAAYGMTQIAEIHRHGVTIFDDTARFIIDVKERQRSKDHKDYTDEFCTRSMQMFGRHILGVMEVGATNIASEVHKTMYTPHEAPKKR